MKIAADLPFGIPTTRLLWEVKVIGLLLIFGYAFFKFAWGLPAVQLRRRSGRRDAVGEFSGHSRARAHLGLRRAHGRGGGAPFHPRAARFLLRACVSGLVPRAWTLTMLTAFVLVVMWSRQFVSDAHEAIEWEPPLPAQPPAPADKP